MTSQLLHANLRLAALGLLVSTSLFAQTAATPPADETVTLSPFSVSTSADRGYNVSESMTGSRVKTQIIDLPYTVNVMTSEFLEDFGLFELADNVTHISGFTGLDVGGNFVLRGFTSSNQLRDGFFRLGRLPVIEGEYNREESPRRIWDHDSPPTSATQKRKVRPTSSRPNSTPLIKLAIMLKNSARLIMRVAPIGFSLTPPAGAASGSKWPAPAAKSMASVCPKKPITSPPPCFVTIRRYT